MWRKDLNADIKQRVRQFFLSYGKGPDAARETAILNKLLVGLFLADVVPTFGMVNMIGGECDR